MARDLRLARDIGCRDARRVVPRPEGTRSPGDGSQASHLESYALLLGSARFWGYTLCMTCSMGTLYIFFDGAPLVVGPTLETSSATLGLYIGMVPAGFVLGSYLTGRIATRMSPGPTLVLARLSTCLGLACGLILAIAGSTPPRLLRPLCVHRHRQWADPADRQYGRDVRAARIGRHGGGAGCGNIDRRGAVIASVAGLFLGGPGETGTLFGLLLTSAMLALSAAIVVSQIDRRGVSKRARR